MERLLTEVKPNQEGLEAEREAEKIPNEIK
jgi:hypothetical protein